MGLTYTADLSLLKDQTAILGDTSLQESPFELTYSDKDEGAELFLKISLMKMRTKMICILRIGIVY